ncbi:MAG: hypothetical protein HUJ25_08410 [Crocinitomicaceae bacterium]|nr:hypothetical protein [Crocinitomicaceae bacterium]
MKKLIILLSLLFLSYTSEAQLWFDLGLKGGVGSGIAMNKTINDDGRFNPSAGFNYFFGGKFGINYGHYVGITCDVDYGAYKYGFQQAEVPGKPDTESYKFTMAYNSINVMPMFRFTKDASYLEVGPQFQFVRNPSIEDEAYPGSAPSGDYISSRLTGLVFGFGAHMLGNEVISLMMGLRFNYVLSDLTADDWVDSSFPFNNYPDITTHTKTNPINAQIVMEVNYSLGYFAKNTSGCGKRVAFLTF